MARGGDSGRDEGTGKKRLTALGIAVFDPQGPTPPEGVIDMLCQAFYCTPDEAMELDPNLALSVLDHRAARATIRQHNQDVTKLTKVEADFILRLADLAEDAGTPAHRRLQEAREIAKVEKSDA